MALISGRKADPGFHSAEQGRMMCIMFVSMEAISIQKKKKTDPES